MRTLLVAGFVLLAATCKADIIYSDLPASGPLFDPGSGVFIPNDMPSIPITPSLTEYLTEVDFVVSADGFRDQSLRTKLP